MSTQPVNIDDLPIGRFHLKIAGLTFGAHLADGYILGMIGIALTLISPQMQLDAFWQGLVGASALIGLFLGSLFFGWISDTLGRQKIFLVSFVLITIASAMQFYVETALALVLCRVLIGIGLGGDYSVGHALLAEFSPKKYRGVLLGAFSVIWTFGYVAATIVGTTMLSLGDDAWRWMLASSAIPAGLILIARIGTPESPRWLVNRGRIAEPGPSSRNTWASMSCSTKSLRRRNTRDMRCCSAGSTVSAPRLTVCFSCVLSCRTLPSTPSCHRFCRRWAWPKVLVPN